MSAREQSTERVNSAEDSSREHLEVAVVGGGQAGLAMGYYLREQGLQFAIFEGSASIAPAWRERWDSLTLFTPRRYSALPGLPFSGEPDGYPTRDEVISYLDRYAETFELPIELNSEVRNVSREPERFVIEVDGRTVTADQVVIATGPFQTPFVPKLAGKLEPKVWQAHSTGYRRPGDLPEGTVLVVGGGNTGFQIAQELSATRPVHLAVGSRQKPLPHRLEPPRGAAALRRRPEAPAGGRLGPDGLVRRRRRGRCRRGGVGHRLPSRLLLDRAPGDGFGRARPPPQRRYRRPRPLLPRPHLAAHPRLGPARLGPGRRGVPRRADRGRGGGGERRGGQEQGRCRCAGTGASYAGGLMQHQHTPHAHGGTADLFPTETAGLPERARPEVVEVAGGGELDLHIAPVAARLG